MRFYKSYFLGITGIILLLIALKCSDGGLDYDTFTGFNNLVLLYICFFYHLDILFHNYLFNHKFYLTLPIRRSSLIYKEILLYAKRVDVLAILLLTFFCVVKNQTFLLSTKPLFLFFFFLIYYLKYLTLISIIVILTQWTPGGDYDIKKKSLSAFILLNVLLVLNSDSSLIKNDSPFQGILFSPFVKNGSISSIELMGIFMLIFSLLIIWINKKVNKWPLAKE